VRAPHLTMGTEVVGTLTHVDARHRGNAPHSTPRAFITIYNRFTNEIILCGCYACGQIRVREQIRMTLKTNAVQRVSFLISCTDYCPAFGVLKPLQNKSLDLIASTFNFDVPVNLPF
jgi:hypothetical protein